MDKTIKSLLKDVKKIKCVECRNISLETWNTLWLHLFTQRKYWCEECNTETIVNHSEEYINSLSDNK